MDHFIDHLEIRNFKSIRELKLTGFKRINLFIGRPNVGKSNLLEALSLFSLPYVWEGSKKFTDITRLGSLPELFFESDFKDNPIDIKSVRSDFTVDEAKVYFDIVNDVLLVSIKKIIPLTEFISNNSSINLYKSQEYSIGSSLKLKSFDENFGNMSDKSLIQSVYKDRGVWSLLRKDLDIKSYKFVINKSPTKLIANYLFPPYGINVAQVLVVLPELRALYAQWFQQYGLELVIDTASRSLKIQKDIGGGQVFQLPYSSVADTLQRIIFYKTAIASNQNSVLLFEEPEAHAYPPYISEFTQEVIGSKTNQTFIVTHSPLIVNDMLENAIDDLAIFMVDFKDGQTVSRPLTNEELHEVRKFGMDLFFNGEAYPV